MLISPLRQWSAAALWFALAAVCGGSANAAAADGVTRTTLLIGQTITLQGGKNAYGMAVQDGIAAYLKVANDQGGVHEGATPFATFFAEVGAFAMGAPTYEWVPPHPAPR